MAPQSLQPNDRLSLSDALGSGQLKPLDRSRVRAQLAFASWESPAEWRLAMMTILARVREYMRVVEYAGPDYVYGRADSEYPYAQKKAFEWCHGVGWSCRSITADAQADMEEIFTMAGAMCLNTACRVAAYEIAQAVPESSELLKHAARVLSGSVSWKELSGINWKESRRRLKNKELCKVLAHLAKALAAARVGMVDRYNAVIAPTSYPAASWKSVKAWHEPVMQVG